MSGGGDILDGFFSQPAIPFNPAGGGGTLWSGKQQQQQQQEQSLLLQQQQRHIPRPHTPNTVSPDATMATSASSSTQSDEKGGAGHLEDNNNNNNSSYGRGGAIGNMCRVASAGALNQAFTSLPSMHPSNMTQHFPSHQMQQVGLSIPHNVGALRKTMESNGSEGTFANVMKDNDVMLGRLIACLSECRAMATLQMQLLQVTTPSSPAASILQQVVLHLIEDIGKLGQLREMFPSATAMKGMELYHMTADLPREPLVTSQPQPPNELHHHQHHHHQQQQQQQQMDVNGNQMFGSPSASELFYNRGIWCFPEDRGTTNKNGHPDFVDGNSCTETVAAQPMQQQQRYFEAAIPTSNQTVPYMGGGVAGGSAAGGGRAHSSDMVHNPSNSQFVAAEEDASTVYATPNEAGGAFVESGMGIRGRSEIVHGPPHRPVESPSSGECKETEKFLAFVEFKRHRVRKYECNIDISPGQYVMVDGDRGRDCGLLVQTIKIQPDGSTAFFCMDGSHVNADKIKLEKGRVLGVATIEEIDYLHHTMQRAERVALETCKKVCDDMGIKINLQDCEYQFDMEKVSFYFNSEHSVDFRPLVRELYRTFRVRIWMENTNPHVKNAMPTGDLVGCGNNNNLSHGGGDDGAGMVAIEGSVGGNYIYSQYSSNNNNNHNKHGGARHGGGGGASSSSGGGGGGGGGRRRGPRWSQKQTRTKDGEK